MAILKIARMGHPVLRRRAGEVAALADPELARLVADMQETMADASGAGIAAPQVYASRRVVMFRVPAERVTGDAADPPLGLTVLINPEVEPLTEEQALGWEGCLSVPGLRGLVPRYTRLRYRGLAPDGTPIEREVSGFHARVVQHECDHLDGILYPQRMTDLSKLIFESEWRAFAGADSQPPADD
jgi:peptide deformylase